MHSNNQNHSINSRGEESPNSDSLPNVKAQRWTWLARYVLLGAQIVTDMAIRCSAWLGSDELDRSFIGQWYYPNDPASEAALQESIQIMREFYPKGCRLSLEALPLHENRHGNKK